MRKVAFTAVILFLLATLFILSQLPFLAPQQSRKQSNCEILSYDINVSVNTTEKKVYTQSQCLLKTSSSVDSIEFLLNKRSIIDKVSLDGAGLKYESQETPIYEAKKIICHFDRSISKNQEFTLYISTSCEADCSDQESPDWMGIIVVRDDEFRFTHQSYWYPIFTLSDNFMSFAKAPARLQICVPKVFSVLSMGKLVSESFENNQKIYCWNSSTPSMYSIIGRTEQLESSHNYYSLLPALFNKLSNSIKDEVSKIKHYYTDLYGAPSNDVFGIAGMKIKNPQYSYNYSTGGYVVFPDSYLAKQEGNLTFPFCHKLAHEIAHNWFPGTTNCEGAGWRFVSEGTAEYMARRYMEANYSNSYSEMLYLKDIYKIIEKNGSLLSSSKIAYSKGPWVHKMLQLYNDHDLFLKELLAKYKSTTFTIDQFKMMYEEIDSINNFDNFYHYWIEGSTVPKLQYDYCYSISDNSLYHTQIKINVTPPCPDIPIKVLCITNHQTVAQQINLSGQEEISFYTKDIPFYCIVDPNLNLLAQRPLYLGETIYHISEIFNEVSGKIEEDPQIFFSVANHLEDYLNSFQMIMYAYEHDISIPEGENIYNAPYAMYSDWNHCMKSDAWSQCGRFYGNLLNIIDELKEASREDVHYNNSVVAFKKAFQNWQDFLNKLSESKKEEVDWMISLSEYNNVPLEISGRKVITLQNNLHYNIEKVIIHDLYSSDELLISISTRKNGDLIYLAKISGNQIILSNELYAKNNKKLVEGVFLDSNQLLLILSYSGENQVVLYNLANDTEHTISPHMDFANICRTINSSKVGFTTNDKWGGGDIGLYDLTSSHAAIFLSGKDDLQYPSFHPFMDIVAFCKRSAKKYRLTSRAPYSLYLYDLNDNSTMEIPLKGTRPAWSSDGQYLGYYYLTSIYCYDIGDEENFIISDLPASNGHFHWIPNSHKVIYATDNYGTFECLDIDTIK